MAGSHGSLAKAGKVRNQTPKVVARERHTPIPRLRNKRNYIKRVIEAKPQDRRMRGRRR
ncbi:MAG: 30S ribosomal protein S30e [Candidatus Hodarchaeales archaeon]|jgi:small subunit ribosomal protein S30e